MSRGHCPGYGVLLLALVALFGCGSEGSGGWGVSESGLTGTDATPPGDGATVTFIDAGAGAPPFRNVLCEGVAVGKDLVLTTQTCAALVNVVFANQVSLGTSTADLQFAVRAAGSPPTSLNIADIGRPPEVFAAGPSLAFVRVIEADLTASRLFTTAPSGSGTVAGTNSGQVPQWRSVTIGSTVGDHVCVTPNTGFETGTDSEMDDGAPVFDPAAAAPGSILGLIDAGFAGCAGGEKGMVPFTGIAPVLDASTISGSAFRTALVSAGPVFELLVHSDGFRTFSVETGIPTAIGSLYSASPATDFSDVNGDGLMDIVVSVGGDPTTIVPPTSGTTPSGDPILRTDLGTAFVLSGSDLVQLGGGGSVTDVNPSWKGFPTAYDSDGRFLTIGERGFSSVAVVRTSTLVRCRSALDVNTVQIQVFDPDTDLTIDNSGPPSPQVRTCVRIAADNDGNPDNDDPGCVSTLAEGVDFKATSGSAGTGTATDNIWFSPSLVSLTSCIATGDLPAYRVDVYLDTDGDCNSAESVDATGLSGVINGFKVRSTCEVGPMSNDAFSFVARDSAGGPFAALAGSTVEAEPNGTYDHLGTFTYKVDTSAITDGNFTLTNADADDCDLPGCAAGGRGIEVHFLPFSETSVLDTTATSAGSGDVTGLTALGSAVASLLAQNPSGNFSDTAGDLGEFEIESGTNPAVAVLWRNVRVTNAITVYPITGSPAVHPVLSNDSTWVPPVRASTPETWNRTPAEIALLLPLEIGEPGFLHVAESVAEAQALLTGADPIVAALAAVELNVKRAEVDGKDLLGAVVRGTDVLVFEAVEQAERVLSGADPATPATLDLLAKINGGLVLFTSMSPALPTREDPDEDGFANVSDNCPVVANPLQENTVISDDLGDACDPTPFAECVVKRGDGAFTAFFGYENPFRVRRISGELNRFTTGEPDRGQPTVQFVGRQERVFSVDFDGSPLTWELAGKSATASSATPACEGGEVTDVRVGDRVALLASQRMELGDRFEMVELGTIAAGQSGVRIGDKATLGDILSEGIVRLGDRVNVEGSIRANRRIILGSRDTVAGITESPAGVEVDDIGLDVPAPSSTVAVPPVRRGETLTLAPGAYGRLFLGAQAVLNLTSGRYDFTELHVGRGARIVVDEADGVVEVTVRNELSYEDGARTLALDSDHPSLLVQYLGVRSVRLESRFSGSIVAPNAELRLDDAGPFEGTFFAKVIETRDGATVRFVALDDDVEPLPSSHDRPPHHHHWFHGHHRSHGHCGHGGHGGHGGGHPRP